MRLTSISHPFAFKHLRAADAQTAGGSRTTDAGRYTAFDRFRIGYSGSMSTNVSIEVDKQTADVLQARAAKLGVTVPQLLAELAALDSDPRKADADEIAELDRRLASATQGARVPHERVVQWLRTWGTPRFRPWSGQ